MNIFFVSTGAADFQLEQRIPELLRAVHDGLYSKALANREARTWTAKTFDELKELALLERTRYKGCLIDINQTALELGRAHARERGLADRAVFMRQDVHSMDFPDGYADLIISRGSYHFWADLEKALTEIYRVLAPGGNTYIGGGMGSAALAESIRPQMQAVMPGWPDGPLQRSGKISTEYLNTFLERQSIPHEIVENQEQGRWIIMHK